MKKIYLISLMSFLLVGCSDYLEETLLASCIQGTPGGSSYVELCECRTDLLIDSLTSEKKVQPEETSMKLEMMCMPYLFLEKA